MLIDALWIVHRDYAGRTRPSVTPTPYIERTVCYAVLHFILFDQIVNRYKGKGERECANKNDIICNYDCRYVYGVIRIQVRGKSGDSCRNFCF